MDRDELIAALVEEMPWYVSAAMRYQIAVAHQLEMPVTDLHALGALLEAPVGVSGLARLMGLTTGAVTRIVDRLEAAGYVQRERSPDDHRRVLLHLVPQQVERIGHYFAPLDTHWRRQLAGYEDDELRLLLDFTRQGREYTKAETSRLRSQGRSHGTRRRGSHGS